MKGYKLDLRRTFTYGETYKIDTNDGFMGYTAFYRFNGREFAKIMSHRNCDTCTDFRRVFTLKEFKSFLSKIREEDVSWEGILDLM